MIRKAADIRLKALPVTANMEHLYYYEGPCRFGKGESLEVGYDRLSNAQIAKAMVDRLHRWAPANVDVLEPVMINRTDNWDNPEEQWERLAKVVPEADVIVAHPRIGTDDLFIEMIERFDKPVLYSPDGICGIAETAAIRNKPGKKHVVYANRSWEQLAARLSAFRAAKVIRSTNFLLATRFGNTTSFSSVDSFNNYDLITARLGVHFRFINAHELLDQMSPAVEGGNHTTPGRVTPDLTEEDMAEVKKLADELMAGADEVEVSREYLENSLIAYVTVRKNLDLKDCNAFSIPCPDVCSTRRMNEQKITFCLTHSLMAEQGIPSTCEFDVCGGLSEQALIAVSGHSPYLGNSYPVRVRDGKVDIRLAAPEELEKLGKDPENLYYIAHSIAHRRMPDPNSNAPYALRHFAQDQGFGAIIRYDWNRDAGTPVTLCRFSPDGSRILIARGVVEGGAAYRTQGCGGPIIVRVPNADDLCDKQCSFGMHLPLVYGDYTKELKTMADILGIEAVMSV